MKINIEKSQIWTTCEPPSPPISLLLVRSYLNFHTICKIEKETLFVHENFSIQGLVFLYIYKYIYIYKKNRTSSVFIPPPLCPHFAPHSWGVLVLLAP